MKLLAMLILVSSCAHRWTYQEFTKKVEQSEAQSLAQVKTDTDEILAHHPELDTPTKKTLKDLVNQHLQIHSSLRQEEAKVIHVMLEESLKDPKPVAKHFGVQKLQEIYVAKAKNIAELVQQIRFVTQGKTVNQDFYREIEQLMREIR